MKITLRLYTHNKLKEYKENGEKAYTYKGYEVRRHSAYQGIWVFMAPENIRRIAYYADGNAEQSAIQYAEMYFRENGI